MLSKLIAQGQEFLDLHGDIEVLGEGSGCYGCYPIIDLSIALVEDNGGGILRKTADENALSALVITIAENQDVL